MKRTTSTINSSDALQGAVSYRVRRPNQRCPASMYRGSLTSSEGKSCSAKNSLNLRLRKPKFDGWRPTPFWRNQLLWQHRTWHKKRIGQLDQVVHHERCRQPERERGREREREIGAHTWYKSVLIYIYICVCVFIYLFIFIYLCIYAYIYNYIYIHNIYLLRTCLIYLYTLFIYLILYLCSCLHSSSLPNRQWAVKKTLHITNNVINAANGSSQLLQEFLHGDLLDGHKKTGILS